MDPVMSTAAADQDSTAILAGSVAGSVGVLLVLGLVVTLLLVRRVRRREPEKHGVIGGVKQPLPTYVYVNKFIKLLMHEMTSVLLLLIEYLQIRLHPLLVWPDMVCAKHDIPTCNQITVVDPGRFPLKPPFSLRVPNLQLLATFFVVTSC